MVPHSKNYKWFDSTKRKANPEGRHEIYEIIMSTKMGRFVGKVNISYITYSYTTYITYCYIIYIHIYPNYN